MPEEIPHFSLNKIWHVCADDTYCVKKHYGEKNIVIALRTVNGEGILRSENQSFSLKKGSLLFVFSEKILSYRTFSDKWDFFWFEINASLLNLPLGTAFNFPISVKETFLLKECYELLSESDGGLTSSCLFGALLFSWLKHTSTKKTPFFQKVIFNSEKYIFHNIEKDVSVSELAAFNNISERYLHKIFRAVLNISPKTYILGIKLKIAAELLKTTDIKISHIALQTGFDNAFYLSRIFKKYYSLSPSEYRKHYLN